MTAGSRSLDSQPQEAEVQFTSTVIEAPGWTWSKRVRVITIFTMLVIVSIGSFIEKTFGFPSSVAISYSNFLGLLALVLSFFQFIPQIYKTYLLQVLIYAAYWGVTTNCLGNRRFKHPGHANADTW